MHNKKWYYKFKIYGYIFLLLYQWFWLVPHNGPNGYYNRITILVRTYHSLISIWMWKPPGRPIQIQELQARGYQCKHKCHGFKQKSPILRYVWKRDVFRRYGPLCKLHVWKGHWRYCGRRGTSDTSQLLPTTIHVFIGNCKGSLERIPKYNFKPLTIT